MNKIVIPDNATVIHYSTTNYDEIVYSRNQTTHIPTRKISKTSYTNTNTGEIKEYKTSNRKTVDNFKKQFKKVPRLIRGSFVGDSSEVHIVLTYSEFINDFSLMTKNFNSFFDKIKRRYGECIYFCIKEPHCNGSWHMHCLLKRVDNSEFNITADEIRALWDYGTNVYVKEINSVEKLCWYFDITRNGSKLNRLAFYPVGKPIVTHSRCIRFDRSVTTYKEVKDKLGNNKPIYSSDKDISYSDGSGKSVIINQIRYEQYKK